MLYDRANLDFEISFSTQGEFVTDKKGDHVFSASGSPWFPLGSLLFSFLDVDWRGMRSQTYMLDEGFDYSSDNNDILPLINFYREKHQQIILCIPFSTMLLSPKSKTMSNSCLIANLTKYRMQ